MVQYEGNRVNASVLFDEVQHGDSIHLRIWRDKAAIDVELPLFVNRKDRISGNQYIAPPYLIVGGLVFTELSRNYLGSLGREWRQQIGIEAIYELFYRAEQDEETASQNPIILSKILKHPSNIDFGVGLSEVLTEVNGLEIGSIEDLYSALENSPDSFHRFKFMSGREEALQIEAARAADTELLNKYQIPSAYRLTPAYE
jgi:hypothetical protein